MPITSFAFAGFTLAALLVYHRLTGRAKQVWLLLVSLVFFALWDWRFGLVLLALTLVNYWLSLRIASESSRGTLWLGLGLNLAVLILFRDVFFSWSAYGLLVPIGLSFYFVQVVAYFVDLRMGRMQPERDWLHFTLYLFYFPKVLSGPIERARSFIPRMVQPQTVDAGRVIRSFGLVMAGLVRKLFVADALMALIPDRAFVAPDEFAGQHLAAWLLAYAFALYNDFAGYTSIVRGVSGLFGIELSRNFSRPYFARDFTDFWRRWHISLSEWLRDYIFFPVTRWLMGRFRNRQHIFNLVLPPIITMLVSGLWHGFSWHMLVWGGLHGLYQVVERVVTLGRPARPPDQVPVWRRAAAILVVFSLTALAWLSFRMDLQTAWVYLVSMLSRGQWEAMALRPAAADLLRGRGILSWPGYGLPDPRIFLVILPALWLDMQQEKNGDELFYLQWSIWPLAGLLALAMLLLLLVSGADTQVPFVYQGF
jgi:D-alanyl-lipoteichoic acid acyltransferase DltB (MBOAT superfamily)